MATKKSVYEQVIFKNNVDENAANEIYKTLSKGDPEVAPQGVFRQINQDQWNQINAEVLPSSQFSAYEINRASAGLQGDPMPSAPKFSAPAINKAAEGLQTAQTPSTPGTFKQTSYNGKDLIDTPDSQLNNSQIIAKYQYAYENYDALGAEKIKSMLESGGEEALKNIAWMRDAGMSTDRNRTLSASDTEKDEADKILSKLAVISYPQSAFLKQTADTYTFNLGNINNPTASEKDKQEERILQQQMGEKQQGAVILGTIAGEAAKYATASAALNLIPGFAGLSGSGQTLVRLGAGRVADAPTDILNYIADESNRGKDAGQIAADFIGIELQGLAFDVALEGIVKGIKVIAQKIKAGKALDSADIDVLNEAKRVKDDYNNSLKAPAVSTTESTAKSITFPENMAGAKSSVVPDVSPVKTVDNVIPNVTPKPAYDAISLSDENIISSSSNTGNVYKVGDKVYKNTELKNGSKTIEGEIYGKIGGVSNISEGNTVFINGKEYIETPYYKNVISIDTIPKESRIKAKNTVNRNFDNIVKSVNELSSLGYSYGDPLQFGLDKNGVMRLMDFSNASKANSISEAFEDNYQYLSQFLEQFGAEEKAKIISDGVYIKGLLDVNSLADLKAGDTLLSQDEIEKLIEMKRFNDIPANNIYYTKNARGVASKTPIMQSENTDGIKYVFSEQPIDPKTIDEYELTPIFESKIPNASTIKTSSSVIPNVAPKGIDNIIPTVKAADNNVDDIVSMGTGAQKTRGYYKTSIADETYAAADRLAMTKADTDYLSLPNVDTSTKADYIFNKGMDVSKDQFQLRLKNQDPISVPLGKKIAKEYFAQGNTEAAIEVIDQLAKEMTAAGQFTQAAAIDLIKENPVSALLFVQKQLSAMNASGLQKYGKKWPGFELTDAEKALFGNIKVGDADAIKKAMETVGARIAKDYPTTKWEKVVELSRVSMLLNPKTMLRNTLGNVLTYGMQLTSRKISALGQTALQKMNPDFVKTQAFSLSKRSKDLGDQAFEKFGIDLMDIDKYDKGFTSGIVRNKEVFDLKKYSPTQLVNMIRSDNEQLQKPILEYLRGVTYDLLEKSDRAFVKKNYVDRIASYIEAQNIKSLDELPEVAKEIAAQEALKATFKDNSMLAKKLASFKSGTGPFGEILVPFTKTPANIAMRGVDYSPIGAAVGAKKLVSAIKNGGDAAKAMDQLAKGLTGTAAVTAGYLLAQSGFITGGYSKDKDQKTYQQATGFLPYAIHIPGVGYYSYDWAQPASIPLIMGVAIKEAFDRDSDVLSAATSGVSAIGDTVLSMSPLQNLKEIFSGYGSASENIVNTALEFPQRLIPSVLGQAARSFDPLQRDTYANKNVINQQIDIAAAKIPGVSLALPAKVNIWGKEITNYTNAPEFALNLINRTANPGRMTRDSANVVETQINALYQNTQDRDVFPRVAPTTVSDGGKSYTLNGEDRRQWQTIAGQQSFTQAQALISSSRYARMTDAEKVKALDKIYDDAYNAAKTQFLNNKGV